MKVNKQKKLKNQKKNKQKIKMKIKIKNNQIKNEKKFSNNIYLNFSPKKLNLFLLNIAKHFFFNPCKVNMGNCCTRVKDEANPN